MRFWAKGQVNSGTRLDLFSLFILGVASVVLPILGFIGGAVMVHQTKAYKTEDELVALAAIPVLAFVFVIAVRWPNDPTFAETMAALADALATATAIGGVLRRLPLVAAGPAGGCGGKEGRNTPLPAQHRHSTAGSGSAATASSAATATAAADGSAFFCRAPAGLPALIRAELASAIGAAPPVRGVGHAGPVVPAASTALGVPGSRLWIGAAGRTLSAPGCRRDHCEEAPWQP